MMDLEHTLPAIRILAYGVFALYAAWHGRWMVWLVFTALVLSTYVYKFTGMTEVAVELIRTAVGVGLIYITLRRL